MREQLAAINSYLKQQQRECSKIKYYSPAAAKKALRKHGYKIGCRQWYLCPECEGEVYHLTSLSRKHFNKRKP